MKYYIKVTCAFKRARKLPRKIETFESAKCVPCNTRKCTHNGFVSDLLSGHLSVGFMQPDPGLTPNCNNIVMEKNAKRKTGRRQVVIN